MFVDFLMMAILTIVLIYISLIMSDVELRLLPGLPQQCATRPLRISSCQSPLSSPWGPYPLAQAWTSTPSPTLCSRWGPMSHFLTGKCCSAMISVVNPLYLTFQTPIAEFLSKDSKLCFCPACEGVSNWVETFIPSQLPPLSTGPHPEILCLFFFFFPTSF